MPLSSPVPATRRLVEERQSVTKVLYDVYGVGNSLVDIQAHVSDEFLQMLGYPKGGMTLVDEATQLQVLEQLNGESISRCAGGSAANTIMGIADFGGRAAYAGKTGQDEIGEFFLQDMRVSGCVLKYRPCRGCRARA